MIKVLIGVLGICLFYFNDFIGILYLLMMLFILAFSFDGMLISITSSLYGGWGLDFYSFYMVMLSMFILSLISIVYYSGLLSVMYSMMFMYFFFMFISLDFFLFFFFFEASIIPMFIMIIYFGGSKERYSSSLYMFIYTLMSSLPMLWVVFMVYTDLFSLNMKYLEYGGVGFSGWGMFFFIMMFMVKVPMFFVHIWLPKAHVDAPVFGSMVLASIMLKMGGYGMIRFMGVFNCSSWMSDMFISISVVGGILMSIGCMYQVDQKVMVAYSSIIHMGTMLGGIFSNSEVGWMGGVIMMLSHGIISSCMFYYVDFMYSSVGSRLLMFMGGILSVYPILGVYWFVILVSNLGCPPFFSVYSEVYLISSLVGYSYYLWLYMVLLVFLVSCFVINIYVGIVGGGVGGLFKGGELVVWFYGTFYHLFFLLVGSLFMINMF